MMSMRKMKLLVPWIQSIIITVTTPGTYDSRACVTLDARNIVYQISYQMQRFPARSALYNYFATTYLSNIKIKKTLYRKASLTVNRQWSSHAQTSDTYNYFDPEKLHREHQICKIKR